jgi:predicted ATPase
MFKKITLKNYRTHVDTTLSLKDVTLLIGGNNSGKSRACHQLNLLIKFLIYDI